MGKQFKRACDEPATAVYASVYPPFALPGRILAILQVIREVPFMLLFLYFLLQITAT